MQENLYEIESEIERLYAERDKEIELHHLKAVPMEFIEAWTKKTLEDYAKRIEPLERRRKFILERNVAERKPEWYKNPAITVPAIVTILAAIIAVLFS